MIEWWWLNGAIEAEEIQSETIDILLIGCFHSIPCQNTQLKPYTNLKKWENSPVE